MYWIVQKYWTLARGWEAHNYNEASRMKENPMATVSLLLFLLHLHTHLSICNGLVSVSVVGLNSVGGNGIEAIPRRGCGEEVGQCLGEEMDWEWETSSRRVLIAPKKYISYETLRKDMTPCDRPGASYYNCRAAGEANPYTRGCEVITGCARDVRDIKTWIPPYLYTNVTLSNGNPFFCFFWCVAVFECYVCVFKIHPCTHSLVWETLGFSSLWTSGDHLPFPVLFISGTI